MGWSGMAAAMIKLALEKPTPHTARAIKAILRTEAAIEAGKKAPLTFRQLELVVSLGVPKLRDPPALNLFHSGQ